MRRGRGRAALLAAALVAAGCQGSASSTSDTTTPTDQVVNTPPATDQVVNPPPADVITSTWTGPDVTVFAGDTASLPVQATAGTGKTLTHRWRLVSSPIGSGATIAPDAPVQATFQTDVEGLYQLELTLDDGSGPYLHHVVVRADPRYAGGERTGTVATASADLSAIAARIDAVLAIGYNTVTADAIAKQLMGKDSARAASAIVVVDVRSPTDFARGHIPGALNVPLAQLPAVLLGNPGFIPAKEVVVASYNGNDGNMASLLLNLARIADPAAQLAAENNNKDPSKPKMALPYPYSRALFMGMTSWTFDRALSPTRFDDDRNLRRVEDGATEKTARAGVDQQKFPDMAAFNAATDDLGRRILVRAREYLGTLAASGGFWTDFVKYRALLANGDPSDDPLVLSVRGAADYAKGHVPGAINIAYQKVAALAQAKVLPPDRKIYVYCYTGHTGALATMALGLLGYDAENLLYGINGWTLSTDVGSGALKNFDVMRGWDFPLHDTVSNLVGFVPSAAGCKACHTSLTALAYDLWLKPLAVTTAVQSEGEG